MVGSGFYLSEIQFLHVLKFCKTVNAYRDTIDSDSLLRIIPNKFHNFIYMTGGLTSVLNPLLYGAYYYHYYTKNRNSGQANSQRNVLTTTEV